MRRLALPLVVLLLAASPVRADDDDAERARRALERGDVLPLAEVLAAVEQQHPGRVIEVELEEEDGRLVYELKLLAGGGRLLEIYADARTAEVLEVEEEDD